MTTTRQNPKGYYKKIKHAVWERDDFICVYCGARMREAYEKWRDSISKFSKLPIRKRLVSKYENIKRTGGLRPTVDHVIPRSLGGETTIENLVTSCSPCNNKKGCSMLVDKPLPFPETSVL